jgi:hypothetical protein
MIQQAETTLSDLYESDETAWLETMAELLEHGQRDDLDYVHLQEYLSDMAHRDRREVESRLITLVMHILKWVYQPDHRSRSWRSTILEQRRELGRAIGRGVLLNHAETVLPEVYPHVVERAASETDLPIKTFPAECPFTLDEILSFEVMGDDGIN